MEKNSVIIFLIFCLVVSCFSKKNEIAISDIKYGGFKGSVYLVKQQKFDAERKLRTGVVKAYDSLGNQIAKHFFGSVGGKLNYKLHYNKLGKIIKTEEFLDNKYFSTTVNFYDNTNNLSRIEEVDRYGDKKIMTYSYDTLGFIMVEQVFGEIDRVIGYNYTKFGRVKLYEELVEGNVAQRVEYEYKDNVLTKMKVRTEEGDDVLREYKVTSTDSLKNWTERKVFANDSLIGFETRSFEYY